MKVDILAIGVHPDDIELSCSGTLLSHIDQGFTVGLCDLTQGELGTRGSAEIRLIEADNARKLMGAFFRENLKMKDGFFTHSEESLKNIIRIIRSSKPSIVLANAIADRHPDHGRAAKLIADACFYSGLSKIVTLDDEGQEQLPWRPKAVYHYVQDKNLKADFVFDISKYMDKKMDLIRCFGTQFFNPESQEPETPISTSDFLEFMVAKNKNFGRDPGFLYAEAFTVNRDIGVKNLFDLL
ncbi:MAG: bacillithiol biosynthesis deacetylase BshB1 [Saprospiraceae bacterium]|nr:bacillithiol biosynthesis deacetylase BshB1 [Saprospiraceae bacterium]